MALSLQLAAAEKARDAYAAQNKDLLNQLAPYLAADAAKKRADAETAKLPNIAMALRSFMTLPKLELDAYEYGERKPECVPLENKEAFAKIKKWAETFKEAPKTSPVKGEVPLENIRWEEMIPVSAGLVEKEYFTAHERMFAEFFARLEGSAINHYMVHTPLLLAETKGEKTLVVGCGISESILNTLKLGERERAKKILIDEVVPLVRIFNASFAHSDAKYWAWVQLFYARSFDGNDKPSIEVVCLVASLDASQRFQEGQTTEDEFIASSDIFISPSGAKEELKKVSL